LSIVIDIDFISHSSKWDAYIEELESIIYKLCEACFNTLKLDSYVEHVELAILLGDDEFIQELNTRFRKKDAPTNVLSFPGEEIDYKDPSSIKTMDGYILLGDIAFSYETIVKESIEQGKLFINHFQHMFVHGLLHLLGYDHIEDDDAKVMEQLEIAILNKFGITSPYEIN
jgi:probable rRNA maturation factor